MKYLNELKALNLPTKKFAIFGSGPIAIRGIRESDDIDIIVKSDLWDILINQYQNNIHHNPTCIKLGNIEIYKDWITLSADKIDEMIDSAEIIADFPFVQLKYVIEWKQQFKREKDIKDIELIKQYNKAK